MSYKIRYETKSGEKRQGAHAVGFIGVVIVFAVWLLAFGFFLPEQAQRFHNMFFPWTQASVKDALQELKEDVNSGIPFRDAAEAFCLELIDEADKNR